MNKRISKQYTAKPIATLAATESEKQFTTTVKAAALAISAITFMVLLTMTILSL